MLKKTAVPTLAFVPTQYLEIFYKKLFFPSALSSLVFLQDSVLATPRSHPPTVTFPSSSWAFRAVG